jgi:hypothetical protein
MFSKEGQYFVTRSMYGSPSRMYAIHAVLACDIKTKRVAIVDGKIWLKARNKPASFRLRKALENEFWERWYTYQGVGLK